MDNFAYVLTLIRSKLGLLRSISAVYNTVMALGYCQNFVSAQNRVKESLEFDQTFAYAVTLT